jgi:hypothetical protein
LKRKIRGSESKEELRDVKKKKQGQAVEGDCFIEDGQICCPARCAAAVSQHPG